MINLRYHIVSITAVFLALGLGIAMGSSFLSDAAVDQVDRNIQSTRKEARDARAEAARLSDEVARHQERSEDLREQGAERLFRDHLDGVPVVILTVGGVDGDSLDLLRTALASSGADFGGTLTITGDVAATGDAAGTVASVLDREGASEATLRAALVTAVADELLGASVPAEEEPDAGDPEGSGTTEVPATDPEGTDPEAPPSDAPPATDPEATTPEDGDPAVPPGDQAEDEPFRPEVIAALVDEGVFDHEPGPDGAAVDEAMAGPGLRYVFVSGPDAEVPDGLFLRPLLRALTAEGPAAVVVASAAVGDDAEQARGTVIAPLLSEEQVASRISTVDDLETFSGLAAVMLSLDDLGADRRGHYGIGPGADSQLPRP